MQPIADPEILAWIEAVAAATPPAGPAMAEQRAAYDAMCAVFLAPRPSGLTVTDDRLATPAGPVPRRHYGPDDPAPVRLVYMHGGGHVLGGLDSHDDICAELAAATRCPVTAVDYRLAPEHPYPAGFEDCLAAARDALAQGPAILAGDSAGGNLAAACALSLGGEPGLLGQVLIYPGLGGETLGLPSYIERSAAPLLSTAEVIACRRLRAGGEPPVGDWRFSPLDAAPERLALSPPAWISAAAVDPLRDDGPAHAAALRAAGVAATCVIEEDLPHMWLRARHQSSRAAAAFARVCAAITELAAPLSVR